MLLTTLGLALLIGAIVVALIRDTDTAPRWTLAAGGLGLALILIGLPTVERATAGTPDTYRVRHGIPEPDPLTRR